MKVRVKQYNICHNGIVHMVGEVFEVSAKEYEGFLKRYCEEVIEKRETLEAKTEKPERVGRKERTKKQ